MQIKWRKYPWDIRSRQRRENSVEGSIEPDIDDVVATAVAGTIGAWVLVEDKGGQSLPSIL
jgi:hypothetical protein